MVLLHVKNILHNLFTLIWHFTLLLYNICDKKKKRKQKTTKYKQKWKGY